MEVEKTKKLSWVLYPMTSLGMFAYKHYSDAMKIVEEERRETAMGLMKNFKTEITKGFWGTKIKLIQRDVPLTDEELEKLFLKK